MATTGRFAALITWRQKLLPNGLTGSESSFAKQLADHLSVEKVEKAGIKVPDRLYKDLVAFRHLRQDARVAAVGRAFNGQSKKSKAPEKDSTIIAVYGYVSQGFDSTKDAEEWLRDRLKRGFVPRGFVVQGKVKTINKVFKK